MKLVVAGSRHLKINYEKVADAIHFFSPHLSLNNQHLEIVSGGCPTGPDWGAKELTFVYGLPYKEFPAEWDKYGNRAGPIRNKKMAVYGDALLLIWDGESRGSKSMKEEMLALKKPVYEIKVISYNNQDEDNSGA